MYRIYVVLADRAALLIDQFSAMWEHIILTSTKQIEHHSSALVVFQHDLQILTLILFAQHSRRNVLYALDACA